MTKDELITKQQLEIEHFKNELVEKIEMIRQVGSILYCIGGPLNDNKDGFKREQLHTFWRIKEALGLL